MPYEQTEVPAELFMEHAGVRVYCTYKNDEIDNDRQYFWFVLDPYTSEQEAFDVRALPGGAYLNYYSSPQAVCEVLKAAIDDGSLRELVGAEDYDVNTGWDRWQVTPTNANHPGRRPRRTRGGAQARAPRHAPLPDERGEEMNHYAVTGRLLGDDEDSTFLLGPLPDRQAAIDAFKAEMWEMNDVDVEDRDHELNEIYINSVIWSESPLQC